MAAVAVGAAAAAVTAAGYINAKLSLSEDLSKVLAGIRAKRGYQAAEKKDQVNAYYLFENSSKTRLDQECYQCEGIIWTWRDVQDQSRKVAHFLVSKGVKRGDTIALFLPNKPAYPIIWLACMSISVIPAFINYNLTGTGLIHCIKIVQSSLLFFDSTLVPKVAEVLPSLSPDLKLIQWDDIFSNSPNVTPPAERTHVLDLKVMEGLSTERFGNEWRNGIKFMDTCMLIFTSGTTGLPKAAVCIHGKVGITARTWPGIHGFNKNTRVYSAMPIYHSAAAVIAIAMSWGNGTPVCIARKFSASKFWDDARRARSTDVQYVGEILRYLMAQPPSPRDKDHCVRLVYGNGCRPDFWEKFRERFGITTIAEFYSATEANLAVWNINKNSLGAGAVGHEGALLGHFAKNNVILVKVDPDTEESIRGPDGFCIRAGPGEPGELLSRIGPGSMFIGYHDNPKANEKKILRDVFAKGDMFFRSGDLLVKDKDRYYWFKDRLGDTFRWKGENIATNDVAEVMGRAVNEANVYGVQLPGHDGRCGCAAIPLDASQINFDKLADEVTRGLPAYAQPLFVRLVTQSEVNGTEKHLKVALRNEGVDPEKVGGDPVYWLHNGKYIPFTKDHWNALKAGRTRL